MIQMLCRFANREALLAACPPAWDVGMPDPEMPAADGALVVVGAILDTGADPNAPPMRRPGYHALALFVAEPLPAFRAAQIQWLPGDPLIPTEVLPEQPPAPGAVPAEITRAQARVIMAAHILPDGRSLLRAMRELLAAQQEATAELPDADPRKIAAAQAAEWWDGAAVYRRDHPVLLQAAQALAIADPEVDALFQAAAAIKETA